MLRFKYENQKKNEKVGKKFCGLQNIPIRGLQIGTGASQGKRDYKKGQL